MDCDKNILNILLTKIIKKEKEFINEKSLSEIYKVKEIKKIIENEVNSSDN